MISVVLATHNEEANLARCLKSVADFADEIIIADGESTDNTVKIAKKFKAKIISTTNKTNFHINKQLSMDAAKGELILQLDADEVVDQELKNFIIKEHQDRLINKTKPLNSQPIAWWLKRKNYFLGAFLKKGGQYPDPVIRLYINGFAKLPQENVHEQMQVDGEIGWADGHLLHYSNPQFKDYLRKFKTYTAFEAERLQKNNFQPNLINSFQYLIIKPVATFFKLFIRHKGFVDLHRGFIFAFMSALHHPTTFIKLLKLKSADST
jgi:glycosyltransferase involved in cell wall biosynthesis